MNKEGTLSQDMTFYPVVDGKTVLPEDMPDEDKKRYLRREKMSIEYRKSGDISDVMRSGDKARRTKVASLVGRIKQSVSR